jgi:hypothetical protein
VKAPRALTDQEAGAILKRQGDAPIKWSSLGGILDGVAETMAKFVGKSLAPLDARVAALERVVQPSDETVTSMAEEFKKALHRGRATDARS